MDYEVLLQVVMDTSQAERILQIEERNKYKGQPRGDWDGTVTGIWQKFNSDGTGECLVNGRPYVVLPQSETSIPKGTNVQVVFSNGQYLASW